MKKKMTLEAAKLLRNQMDEGAQVKVIKVKFAAMRCVKALNPELNEFEQLIKEAKLCD